MNAPAKLVAFTALLAVCGGGAAVAGSAIDPDAPGGGDSTSAVGEHRAMEREAAVPAGHGGEAEGHGDDHAEPAAAAPTESAEAQGLRVELDDATFAAETQQPLRFRIVGQDGAARTDFAVEHEKRMHVIVVRTDLTGFQHLHPEMAQDGTWEVPLTLTEAGDYRVYADFADGTLSADLTVPGGDAHAHPLPAPAATADAGDGYTVTLAPSARTQRPGEEVTLPFTVRQGGKPVQVEPYLGADGHLVAISEGKLEFLHVHPMDGAFMATFPRAGKYRLFLQFQHAGKVHTAEFTQVVGA